MELKKVMPSNYLGVVMDKMGIDFKTYTTDTGLLIGVSIENGLLYISISHFERLPTFDEIAEIRTILAPHIKTMGMKLAPKYFCVDKCPECYHLYEIKE